MPFNKQSCNISFTTVNLIKKCNGANEKELKFRPADPQFQTNTYMQFKKEDKVKESEWIGISLLD